MTERTTPLAQLHKPIFRFSDIVQSSSYSKLCHYWKIAAAPPISSIVHDHMAPINDKYWAQDDNWWV